MSDRGKPRYTAEAEGTPISQPPPAVPAKLVVVGGPDEGQEVPLEKSASLGTEAGNDLVLTDPHVSRRHAQFLRDEGRLLVRDEGSLNGTHVGGARIHEVEVPLGTIITLGTQTAVAVQPRWYVREVSPSNQNRFVEMFGQSVAMREVFAILERVAPTEVNVLFEGETGTGKEVAARSLHHASHRAHGPYVVFDCSSVPKDLAESELFGHRRGAFSGATSDRAGAFQRAHGGTLCLDEIGELPLDLQPKLLRAIEAGEVRAVGDDSARKVDTRVIAATNRDLHAEAARGQFREDLLYRLDVVRVRIPPLRHRPQDIPVLASHFLEGRIDPAEPIEGSNLDKIVAYAWPGNVRELRNTLMRAVALAGKPEGRLPRFSELVLNLGPAPASPPTIGVGYPGVASPLPYKEAKEQLLASFDRAYVEALLHRHGNNVSQAASAAGLSRKHLYDLIRRTVGSIDPSDPSGS